MGKNEPARRGLCGRRYYSESHALLTRLERAGTPFVVRLRDRTVIEYLTGHPLPEEAAGERVIRDNQVRLGGKGHLSAPLRLIQVRSQSGEILLLVTNLPPEHSARRTRPVLPAALGN